MKRVHVHLLFGLAALAFGAATASQALALRRAHEVNAAIAAAADPARLDAAVPEARFARARALAAAGDDDGALKAYQALIHDERGDLRRAALYNLGNLQLRRALAQGDKGAMAALPLIELAKQSYRRLLHDDPQDWDARYNLERALWLAPEIDETVTGDQEPPTPKERALTTMQGSQIELP